MSRATQDYLIVVQPLDTRYRVKQALIAAAIAAASSGWVVIIRRR